MFKWRSWKNWLEAFKYTNIESITILDSIKEIGKGAFSWCTNLKEVILNEGLEKLALGHLIIQELNLLIFWFKKRNWW
ncbi:leucine-rich repeat protein [Metamycoplasma hominis]|uniref:leucine-rich repeat protein n=1 Tax=Metamycoplasma hominis TaxID=2098 RepID=UPI003A5C88D6